MNFSNIISKARLIPRYNWDYSFATFFKAFVHSFFPMPQTLQTRSDLFKGDAFFTTSGRLSLYAILQSLHLNPGSKIGVPLFCCPVVFDAILQAGLMPRFIDITSDTYTISVADLRKKKHELSAIIAVHMFGHMADMDELRAAAGNIPVIEDCAQSLFSTYKGVFAGDIASVSFFSFRSGKHLSVGEGSLIISKDSAMSAALKTEIATYGKWKKGPAAAHCLATWIKSVLYQRPWYGTIGYPIGIKLDKKLNLTAKSGFSVRRVAPGDFFLINKRLQSLRPHIKQQRLNALYYLDKMHNENLVFPFDKPYCESNYYQFALQTNSLEARNRLASHLRMHHIDAAKYLDEIAWEAKEKYGYTGDCPIAEKCSQTVVTVPVYYTLSTKDKAGIVDAVNSFTG